jgi:hypothetical protein
MAGSKRSHEERIRALLDEIDRVRHESASVAQDIDLSMKRSPFYPDRRKSFRGSDDSHTRDDGKDAAAGAPPGRRHLSR